VPTLQIHLLGELRLNYAGRGLILIQAPRLQALLAYLLLRRGVPQPRAHLAFLLWPESSEANARTSLRQRLHELRQLLPDADHFIEADSLSVGWRAEAPVWLDVTAFEQAVAATTPAALAEAVALYRGDLLPSCYDDWIVAERERLRALYGGALERLVAGLEAAHDLPAALATAQRLLHHDPLREATYSDLMRLHALAGDRAAALRVYQAAAATLERELGVEPGPALRDLHDRLVRGATVHGTPPAFPLVGRAQEWAAVQAGWRNAQAGRAQAVVLAGDAGVGKGRLAEELRDWVSRQGFAVAEAHCYAAEGTPAYAPVAEWLRANPVPALPVPWLSEIARLVPDVLVGRPDIPPPGPLSENWQRVRLFEALARALLAQGPLLLVLDDVQWCDHDTLDWLQYLLRYDPQARLLVVLTLRLAEIEADHPLETALAAWRRHRLVTEIAVEPLDAAATMTLAAQVAGHALTPALGERIYAETEGNPLFVLETVQAGRLESAEAEATPPTVRAVIAARLAQLSPAGQEVVRLAATIGRAFTFPVLAGASTSPEDTLIEALDELWQRRIVREQGSDSYDFTHDKLREVAYNGLNPPRRRLLHRRVAQAMAAAHAADPDPVSAQIAAHFEQAGLVTEAVAYYDRAAAFAARIYATDIALHLYLHLLDLLPKEAQAPVLLRVAELRQIRGEWAEALLGHWQALALAQAGGDAVLLAQCEWALGRLLVARYEGTEALEWLERARQGFEQLGDQINMGRVLRDIGRVYWNEGEVARAMTCFEQQLAIATAAGNMGDVGLVLNNIALELARRGEHAAALSTYERCVEIATQLGDRRTVSHLLNNMGLTLRDQFRYPQAVARYSRAIQISAAIGDQTHVFRTIGNMGVAYQRHGDYGRALACYACQLQAILGQGNPRSGPHALGNIATAYLEQGREAEAEQLFQKAIRLARALDTGYYLGVALSGLAQLYARQGRVAAALPLAEEALSIAAEESNKADELGLRCLIIRLRAAGGQLLPLFAWRELQSLLARWPETWSQAEIYYAMWLLDPRQEEPRRIAAEFYQDAYTSTPDVRYARRFEELTGETLPAPPPLPDLPPQVPPPPPQPPRPRQRHPLPISRVPPAGPQPASRMAATPPGSRNTGAAPVDAISWAMKPRRARPAPQPRPPICRLRLPRPRHPCPIMSGSRSRRYCPPSRPARREAARRWTTAGCWKRFSMCWATASPGTPCRGSSARRRPFMAVSAPGSARACSPGSARPACWTPPSSPALTNRPAPPADRVFV
jgi:DNA-binding SARP family transcriptional activator/Tfp pilus assembly protein PilF